LRLFRHQAVAEVPHLFPRLEQMLVEMVVQAVVPLLRRELEIQVGIHPLKVQMGKSVDRIEAVDQHLPGHQVAQAHLIQLLVQPLLMRQVQQATIHRPQQAVQIQAMVAKEQLQVAAYLNLAQQAVLALL
jgi:hypothetical protein